jgi:hypothetical protein
MRPGTLFPLAPYHGGLERRVVVGVFFRGLIRINDQDHWKIEKPPIGRPGSPEISIAARAVSRLDDGVGCSVHQEPKSDKRRDFIQVRDGSG